MTPTTQHPTHEVTPDEDAERQADEYIRAYYANVAARTEATRSLTSDTQRLHRQEWRALLMVQFADSLKRWGPFAWGVVLTLVLVSTNFMSCNNRRLDAQVQAIEEGRGTK